jgi:hypothetical protein
MGVVEGCSVQPASGQLNLDQGFPGDGSGKRLHLGQPILGLGRDGDMDQGRRRRNVHDEVSPADTETVPPRMPLSEADTRAKLIDPKKAKRIAAQGIGVIVITHITAQAFQVADRIIVIRRGEVAGNMARAETSPDEVVRLMTGGLSPPEKSRTRPNGP